MSPDACSDQARIYGRPVPAGGALRLRRPPHSQPETQRGKPLVTPLFDPPPGGASQCSLSGCRRQPGPPDVTRIRHLRAAQEPENVPGMALRPWIVRTRGRFQPAAQVVAVHSPGHAHVLAVLAAIRPLDNDLDQVRKLGSGRLIVVSDSHVSNEALLRAPCLGMSCPLLRRSRLPLQEEQCVGKTRPRNDVGTGRPVPQPLGQRIPPDLLVVPARRPPPSEYLRRHVLLSRFQASWVFLSASARRTSAAARSVGSLAASPYAQPSRSCHTSAPSTFTPVPASLVTR